MVVFRNFIASLDADGAWDESGGIEKQNEAGQYIPSRTLVYRLTSRPKDSGLAALTLGITFCLPKLCMLHGVSDTAPELEKRKIHLLEIHWLVVLPWG